MDPRRQTLWLILAAGFAAVALAAMHALETFGHYLPCELCLRQREVDWVALGVALLALGLGRARRAALAVGCVAVSVAFAVGAGVAAYHAGVEWKWWPGPSACSGHGAGAVSAADVAGVLSGAVKLHMVRCDDAALRVAGLSLAGWNTLASGAMALGGLAVLLTPKRFGSRL